MKPRVLLVDDEPDLLELLTFNLLRRGFEVITASEGFEAIRSARREIPHVIVLDLMLPDIDGFSVCEILRVQLSTRDIPVIILNALDGSANRNRAEKMGVFYYCRKGIEIDELESCIRCVSPRQKKSQAAMGSQ